MPFANPFFSGGGRSRNPFHASRSSGRGGRQPKTTQELQAELADLEKLRQQFGAPEIDDEKPGIFRTIVDVLSRPNYAVAGFTEELLNGRSVQSGVARAMSEILSGVGPIEGQKRAFGEVLEGQGVGTKTLADAFPALEGTWVGNFGSRGAAGLALDIFADPLTYMTFGASTGLRVSLKKLGTKYLNKEGTRQWGGVYREVLDGSRSKLDDAIKSQDRVRQNQILTKVELDAQDLFETRFMRDGDIAKELLEPGGAKLFGATIPGSTKIAPTLGRALNMLPESITKPAIEGAQAMRAGMRQAIAGVFDPNGAFSKLPEPIRRRASLITDSFFESSVSHRGHLFARADDLERQFNKMFGKKAEKQSAWERWHDVREGEVPRSAITTAEEAKLFDETMGLYDSMRDTGLQHGVLRPEQALPGYMHRRYLNAEDLNQYHPRPGVKVEPGNKARFQKERYYETTRDAVRISTELHEKALLSMSKGEAEKLYPILKPDWDVFGNMRSYITGHSTALARKAWSEEMVNQFGKNINDVIPDFDQLYDAAKKPKGAGPDWFNPENVPIRRAIDEFDIEDSLVEAFGKDGAQYVAVKGVQTGNELVYLPKQIAKSLESINSSVFNKKDYSQVSKFLKGYDWINNNFKWGVYVNPIWISSRVRNAYSNMSQSALRIGVAAIDPKRHADAVLLMAGRNLGKQFADTGYTLGQIRELFHSTGIWVPGKVFTESVGRFKQGRVRKVITEATAAVENEARVLLGLEELRRGASIKQAADTVNEFLFNYGRMSRIEQDVFRRAIPFYTFTRKNVELQWKALKRNPGRVINQVKPFRGYNSENEQMVKWEAEGLKIRLDGDGKTVHMLNGIDLPLRNLDTLWAGGVGPTGRRMMGMLAPWLKAPVESVTGTDLFTGNQSGRTFGGSIGRALDNNLTPKAVKDWMGYKKTVDDAGRTSYSFDAVRYNLLVRSWMFSRFVSTSDRQFREYLQDTNTSGALLDFFTGLRAKEVNLSEQTERKIKRRIRQTKESLARRGALPQFQVSGKLDTESEF